MDWSSIWRLQKPYLMWTCVQQGLQPLSHEARVAVSTRWLLTQLMVPTSTGVHQKQATSSISCSREIRPVPVGIFSHSICHHRMHALQMCSTAAVRTQGKSATLEKYWNCCTSLNVIYCLRQYGQCFQTYSVYAVHSTHACKPDTSRTKACLLHLIYCGDLHTNSAYNQKC